jgi:diaminopimelate epimerase
VVAIADRHRGVGFDQLAVMSMRGNADVHLTFYNSDGSTAGACGNATRCIARHIMNETGKSDLTVTTERGTLFARDAGDGMTSVNMGHPQLNWTDIPLAEDVNIDALPMDGAPMATGMGNPHCTFFVDDADAIDLDARGANI